VCQMIILLNVCKSPSASSFRDLPLFLLPSILAITMSLFWGGAFFRFDLSIFPHHLNPSYSINSAGSAPCYLLGCSASPAFPSFYETTHAPYNYPPTPRIFY
jgi:hypothetical protein